ncbi:phenylacetate--CoA ligase family protein [Candidatus Bipolaricaulota bacterium]
MTAIGGRFARYVRRKSPAQSADALRFVVERAARDVPFYKELYGRASVKPGAVSGASDLPRLPIAQRADLLAAGHAGHLRRGVDPLELVSRRTTGTTGEPLTVFFSNTEAWFRKLTLLDSFRNRVRLPLPFSMVDVGVGDGQYGDDWAQRLGFVRIDRVYRVTPLAEQVAQLADLRPDIVEGRPSSLWLLARESRRVNIGLPRPRLVVSFAETLYPHVRAELEHAFGSCVADYYNCQEVGNIAWECPDHDGWMHVNPSTVVVEVVDDGGEPLPVGTVGRVLLTNLYNCTMPFVRYEIGDRAALLDVRECSCGFSGTSIRSVEGRDEDFFLLPDGREISPRLAYEVVAEALPAAQLGNELFQAIRLFQIVQESRDLVAVRVVPGPDYDSSLWAGLEASVRSLHPEMCVRVDLVSEEDLVSSGKFRQVTSWVGRRPSNGAELESAPIAAGREPE